MAEASPLGSFENDRFHGPRGPEGGAVNNGTRSGNIEKGTLAAAIDVTQRDPTAHPAGAAHAKPTNVALQPLPATRSSVIGTIVAQDKVITNAKANQEVQNNQPVPA